MKYLKHKLANADRSRLTLGIDNGVHISADSRWIWSTESEIYLAPLLNLQTTIIYLAGLLPSSMFIFIYVAPYPVIQNKTYSHTGTWSPCQTAQIYTKSSIYYSSNRPIPCKAEWWRTSWRPCSLEKDLVLVTFYLEKSYVSDIPCNDGHQLWSC